MTVGSPPSAAADASFNRVLPQRPAGAHVQAPSAFVLLAFRAGVVLVAVAAAVMTLRHWAEMPPAARVLGAALGPLLLGWALWPGAWSRQVAFVADGSGISFPNDSLRSITWRRRVDADWLHVPWRNIDGLRLSIAAGDDGGRCVAFDVTVTPEQRARYFGHVAAPRDRPPARGGVVHAAFDDALPSPRSTLAVLQALRSRARG